MLICIRGNADERATHNCSLLISAVIGQDSIGKSVRQRLDTFDSDSAAACVAVTPAAAAWRA